MGAIIQHAGTPAIVTTILISSLPVVITVLALGSAAAATYPAVEPRIRAVSWAGYVVVLIIATFTVPWWTTLTVLFAGPMMLVASAVGSRAASQLRSNEDLRGPSGGIRQTAKDRLVRGIAAKLDSPDSASIRRLHQTVRGGLEELEAQSANTLEDLAARADKLSELKESLRQTDELIAAEKVRTARSDAKLVVWVAALLAPALSSVLTSQPWLPAENLRTDKGAHVVGYVIDDGGEWVSLLTEKDRSIQRFARDEIVERSACRIGAARTGKTLWEVMTDSEPSPKYPACP